MILHALRQLALNENLLADIDFEYKPVSWRVNLDDNGRLVSIEQLWGDVNAGTKRKPKREGRQGLVPRQPTRTSGDLANFLVDKAEYVFGIDPAGKRSEAKLRRRAELFRERVQACTTASGDAHSKAVMQFLDSIAADRSIVQSHFDQCRVEPNELFAFRVGLDQVFVHRRPAVVEFWNQQRLEAPPGEGESGFRCLVTGEPMAEVGLFPLIKKLPGGTSSGVALVSHNARAFESYGLSGGENATISRSAAELTATALNRLLHPAYPNPRDPDQALEPRHVKLSANTVVCFWTAKLTDESENFLDVLTNLLDGENEETVEEVYRSVWRGKKINLRDPTSFFALVLSGTQGRAVVRGWFETSLAEVDENLAMHFKDLDVVHHARPKNGQPLPATVPLKRLMRSLAAEGRKEPVPGSLEAAFIRSAFLGIPYPLQLMQRALVRARVESGRDDWVAAARRDARAALIKAVLNRRRRFDPQSASQYQEVNHAMNPNHDSQGYALGLLMAVLERLQNAALGKVNASIVVRFFSAASAAPRSVFVRLLKNAQNHAHKARESDDKRERAVAFRCERMIDQIADRFELKTNRYPPSASGLPSHLALEQQGLFVLGYHQMRRWLWMTKEERAQWEIEHPDAPRAFRWLKEPAEDAGEVQQTVA